MSPQLADLQQHFAGADFLSFDESSPDFITIQVRTTFSAAWQPNGQNPSSGYRRRRSSRQASRSAAACRSAGRGSARTKRSRPTPAMALRGRFHGLCCRRKLIGDIGQVRIAGLADCEFIDKADGGAHKRQSVETTNAARDVITLAPGETHR